MPIFSPISTNAASALSPRTFSRWPRRSLSLRHDQTRWNLCFVSCRSFLFAQVMVSQYAPVSEATATHEAGPFPCAQRQLSIGPTQEQVWRSTASGSAWGFAPCLQKTTIRCKTIRCKCSSYKCCDDVWLPRAWCHCEHHMLSICKEPSDAQCRDNNFHNCIQKEALIPKLLVLACSSAFVLCQRLLMGLAQQDRNWIVNGTSTA